MALRRSIGLAGLTFIGIGGVLGSGWLFAPQLAAQHAGPAAIVSWCIGALVIFLIALPFAEITGCLPEAGAIARLPHYSHGSATSMVIGWSAWLGYATLAPIETVAMLRYMAPLLPDVLAHNDAGFALETPAGYAVAFAVLLVMVAINALGVAWFERANSVVTIVKLLVPVIVAVTILAVAFSPMNFTAHGGFAPYGVAGILSAVSAGGVTFALIGFRHVIDLAGEARRPQFDVPAALLLSVGVCSLVYVLVQIAFVGGLPADTLTGGWATLHFGHRLGPLAAIAVVTGLSWLVALLYAGAVLGPFGAALISTGSNARLALALARNGFFPSLFERLSRRGVPLNALVFGFVVGALMLLTMPFTEMVALNSSAVVLSLCIGPLAMLALRRQLPDRPRPVTVPAGAVVAPIAFVAATLVIYWSGWDTLWRLGLALAVGLVLYRLKLAIEPSDGPAGWRNARWLAVYLVALGAISGTGSFGGTGLVPFGFDMAVVAVIAIVSFRIGLADALSPQETRDLVESAVQGP